MRTWSADYLWQNYIEPWQAEWRKGIRLTIPESAESRADQAGELGVQNSAFTIVFKRCHRNNGFAVDRQILETLDCGTVVQIVQAVRLQVDRTTWDTAC